MATKIKTFSSYQNACDFCYANNIPLSRIEKYSNPKELIWKYTVRYIERRKKDVK